MPSGGGIHSIIGTLAAGVDDEVPGRFSRSAGYNFTASRARLWSGAKNGKVLKMAKKRGV
jgi:hypothetical protein